MHYIYLMTETYFCEIHPFMPSYIHICFQAILHSYLLYICADCAPLPSSLRSFSLTNCFRAPFFCGVFLLCSSLHHFDDLRELMICNVPSTPRPFLAVFSISPLVLLFSYSVINRPPTGLLTGL